MQEKDGKGGKGGVVRAKKSRNAVCQAGRPRRAS